MLLAACVGTPSGREAVARHDLAVVAQQYRPGGARPTLPELHDDGQFEQFVLYAVLNDPLVEADFHAWAGSVHRITVERSLADPRLTLQASIVDITLMALMAGVMIDAPGAGKRALAANIASAESQAKYFAFEARVLQSAFALRKVRYQLHALDAKIDITRNMARLLGHLEQLALVQNEVGRAPMQDVMLARIERARLKSDIANLVDSRTVLLAQFKAALGMANSGDAPPLPVLPAPYPPASTAARMLEIALSTNPRLKAMEAEVAAAAATLQLAQRSTRPDFSGGIEVDAKANPVMLQPSFGISLPIWRDKTRAQIAAAQAGKAQASARLSGEQIAIAVELAEKLFAAREASRRLDLLGGDVPVMATNALTLARSAYSGGKSDFNSVVNAQKLLLDLQLSHSEASLQRELALAELSLLTLAALPAGVPLIR